MTASLPNSQRYSNMTLKQILFKWIEVWRDNRNVTIDWMEYTHAKIANRLVGLLWTSALWKKAGDGESLGLRWKSNDTNWKYINKNDTFEDQDIRLRGCVVVCCHEKIDRESNAQKGFHRKHAVRVIDIFNELKAYIQENPTYENILLHLKCEGDEVIFTPYVEIALDNQVQEIADEHSESGSEIVKNHRPSSTGSINIDTYPPPPEDLDGELPPPDESYPGSARTSQRYPGEFYNGAQENRQILDLSKLNEMRF